mmetsp:Transcript_56824/g.123540  ORF Transcript_56824/g.123540 Transcript_56824/m.123540 type:complete len:237 (+) Transcript_56824:248-958(+)
MSPVSKLSEDWFPDTQRTTATAVASVANGVGATAGFWLGPAVVTSPGDTPTLLYLEAGLALFGLVLVACYFPNRPPTPPSFAATTVVKLGADQVRKDTSVGFGVDGMGEEDEDEQTAQRRPFLDQGVESGDVGTAQGGAKEYITQLRKLAGNGSFVLLMCSGGLLAGVNSAYTGVLQNTLDPVLAPAQGKHQAQVDIGYIDFGNGLAACIGGFAIGPIVDRSVFTVSSLPSWYPQG